MGRKVDTSLMTHAEVLEYERRTGVLRYISQTNATDHLPETAMSRLHRLKVGYWVGGLTATGLAVLAPFIVGAEPIMGMVAGILTAFTLGCLLSVTYSCQVQLATQRWKRGYLMEIGYHTRTERPGSAPSGSSSSGGGYSSGQSYPVTDGMHDPVTYSHRGGYDTFGRMEAFGIDDYETYKNNVEEAE
ncbi:hypothetical protein HP550_14555 [Cellulomonas humilata]|uniref:Uncharacterized protein n=1 Tax=Cellulomonas humilata TaxID=144055 RepID=A0A7Y6DYI7_9CELL|nr:hypothetical protein [Cellulomonas humilata]NUU18475.1 hypothetical protein [Cellulomonas humilata]